MDIQQYIDSGILQEYCMGVISEDGRKEVEINCEQYPEVKAELRSIALSLQRYAETYAKWPGETLQEKIWQTLENLNKEKKMEANDLPLINKFTNYKQWLHMVSSMIPEGLPEERICKVLRKDDDVMQLLLVSATDFEEELHEDLHESFIILEGRCECYVGDQAFQLEAGGFTQIPLHVAHDVKLLTPRVVAILQRIRA